MNAYLIVAASAKSLSAAYATESISIALIVQVPPEKNRFKQQGNITRPEEENINILIAKVLPTSVKIKKRRIRHALIAF